MRNFVVAALLTVAVSITVPANVRASGLCCQLSNGVEESLAGVTAPGSGDLSLQFTYSFDRMDRYREGSSSRSLDEAKAYVKPDGTTYTSLPVSMDMMKYTMTAGYGFSSRLKAFLSVPYVRNTMDMIAFQGAGLGWMEMTMAPTSGVGDATLMGLYRLYTNRDLRPTDVVTLGFGVKAPTGSFTEQTSSGKLVHAHMQPGTGSWDPLLSIVYTKIVDQLLIQTDATYRFATRNRLGYEFGDSTALNLSGTYAIVRELSAGASLTYLSVGRASDKYGNYTNLQSLMDDPANTGGQSLWFSPCLQVFPGKDLAVNAKVQIPVWERVNGIQLVPSYRFLAGIAYRF